MSLKKYKQLIRSVTAFDKHYKISLDFTDYIIQGIDFHKITIDFNKLILQNTSFLGCNLYYQDIGIILDRGGVVYPEFAHKPYKPYRTALYTWQELMHIDKVHSSSTDELIYQHFSAQRYTPPMGEALAQRIHDYSIDEALRRLIGYDEHGMTQKRCIGIMGGHGVLRGSDFYIETALLGKLAAEAGYYIVSGGGPGIMEAANLGAYFADLPTDDLYHAIDILKLAPHYTNPDYISQAHKILKQFPKGKESLAIPTWFYGHEPSNLFASHIAKYFSNSIREDTLLAISLYGVIYAPGSAGTTQEIFQEAAQNHYATYGYYSPMIFLSKKRYVEDTAIYSLLHQLATDKPYKELLYLTDSASLAVEFLQHHPPIPK